MVAGDVVAWVEAEEVALHVPQFLGSAGFVCPIHPTQSASA